ncbi:carboxy-terminal processing proteinase [Lapidilactobacillus concavus DSM 17758]|uniref:Carboxy-terminal processing proteinase n=1 Tax=Lapidilactobacillus concavus DSM 17758 TaxID=1423735 RepID=A0A0R1WDM8_9LACO|nr:S41 family peptidase [Lapidilactobacillus concavus]KRM13785.1 carboxy-terminal processing proteinase [Lapidilactobacillus concavus DSM 17758]GEL12668.1 peptidase S41 [Lapidilactobacillus concavus]
MSTKNETEKNEPLVSDEPANDAKEAPVIHSSKPHSPKRFTRLTYWFSLLCALCVGLILGVLLMLTRLQGTISTNAELSQVINVYHNIQDNYYQKVSKKKLINGAIDGMLTSLDDPFSQYLQSDESTSLNDSVSGSFQGIGAEVQQGKNAIEIVSPIKNSPAAKAGLKSKDLILAINSKSTAKMTVDQAVSQIRGASGSTVTLKIQRGTKTFNVTVKRARVDQATVNGESLAGDRTIGHIQVTTFAENTTSGMKHVIKSLRKQGAKKFIIDVRGNPGGLMNAALSLSSLFLKNKQVIMRVDNRQGSEEVYRAGKKYDNGFKVTEPVEILVDNGSASASEIFSAALQENGRAKLVGSKTYGKGTVQTVVPLSSESEMKFTVAKWLTPNKTWINKKGITPDIKADYPALANYALISSDETLKPGAVGNEVKLLQENLHDLGYEVKETGLYDQQLVNAVKQVQTKAKFADPTGEFDEKTRDALYREVSVYLLNHDNALNAAVKDIQK